MPAGRVQVSPYFDMIGGTRALEVGNKSLDTGLIDLKPSDVYFDCAESRSLPEVAAVMENTNPLLGIGKKPVQTKALPR